MLDSQEIFMRKALTAFALIGASAAASPVWAEARALVVGINEYDQGAPLFGAVADAQDISASLKRFGVQDVTMLLNRQARKRMAGDDGAGRSGRHADLQLRRTRL